MEEKHYDIVVAIFGTNDTQPVRDKKRHYRYGTEAWFKNYRGRVANVLELMCKSEQRDVYWIGLPVMRSDDFNRKVTKMNALFVDEISRSKCAKYIPMDSLLLSLIHI